MLKPISELSSVPATGILKEKQTVTNGQSFEAVLAQASSNELRFSKHAQQRLAERGVQLGETELRKLGGAVDRAAEKGSRDSLVLMDDLALVVSVRNRTVITAVDAGSQKQSIFTNIDSVVLTE